VHVRAIEIGSLLAVIREHRRSAPANARSYLLAGRVLRARAYRCLGPRRGMHFCARTMPVEVILVPEISLTWPAGQVPTSTLTRCPSRNSPMSCSRETCCAGVEVARKDKAQPPSTESERRAKDDTFMIGAFRVRAGRVERAVY